MLRAEITQLKFVLKCFSRKHGKWLLQQNGKVDAINQVQKITEQCKFSH